MSDDDVPQEAPRGDAAGGAAPAPAPAPQRPHVPEDALVRGTPYQAAQRASPWGYVFILGLAGFLTGWAWYRVEGDTGNVTRVWIFLAALLTLAPIAWHAVDFFESLRSRRGGAFVAVVVTVLLGLVLMGVVSALNETQKDRLPATDLTESKRYTLGEQSLKVLASIPDGGVVHATYLERPGLATPDALRRMAVEQLRVYSYHAKNLRVTVIDEFKEPARAKDHLQSVGVVSTSSGETHDLIVLSYAEPGREFAQGKQREIKVEEFTFAKSGDQTGAGMRWLGERVVTSAIQELVFVKRKAYATAGHGEKGLADEMRAVRARLQGQNVEVADRPVDLTAGAVPDDCDLLLALGPRTDFKPEETAALRAWLEKGRALFLTVDVDPEGKRRPVLDDLLKDWGLATHVNYEVNAFSIHRVEGTANAMVQSTTDLVVRATDYARSHPAVEHLARGGGYNTFFTKSSWVEVDTEAPAGVTVDPVVWAPEIDLKEVPRPYALQTGGGARTSRAPDPARDKMNTRLPLVAVASRELTADASGAKREARIVLSGDTDAFSDPVVQGVPPNEDLFAGLAQWALRRADLIAVGDKTLDLEIAAIGDREHRMALWWPLVTALCALLAGLAVWWARRR